MYQIYNKLAGLLPSTAVSYSDGLDGPDSSDISSALRLALAVIPFLPAAVDVDIFRIIMTITKLLWL